MRKIAMYKGAPVFDMFGNLIYEGSLLRYRHPTKGLLYSSQLYLVSKSPDGNFCLTDDNDIIDTDYCKRNKLFLYGHIESYKGEMPILK